MSTILTTIKSSRGTLQLTQFAGNKETEGLMIQVSQGLGGLDKPGYIQLTRPEASQLIIDLDKWLKRTT